MERRQYRKRGRRGERKQRRLRRMKKGPYIRKRFLKKKGTDIRKMEVHTHKNKLISLKKNSKTH